VLVAAPPLVLAAAVVAGWALLVRARDIDPLVLPAPQAVAEALFDDRAALADAALVTLSEMVLGLLVGALAGLALATVCLRVRLLDSALAPLLVASQMIPPIAFAVPLAIWLGYGIAPKVVVTALIVFFPVFVNGRAGLAAADRDHLALLRSMGAGWWRTWALVRVPASLTLVFAALRLGATYSAVGAVFGEWVGAEDGIGVYLLQANARPGQTDRVFAAVVVLALLGALAYLAVVAAERAAMPWTRRSTRRGAPAPDGRAPS